MLKDVFAFFEVCSWLSLKLSLALLLRDLGCSSWAEVTGEVLVFFAASSQICSCVSVFSQKAETAMSEVEAS